MATAVALVAFNRPDYFRRLVTSIVSNPESQLLPFFAFLDGGPGSTQDENEKILRESDIKDLRVIRNTAGLGCGRNIINVRRTVFDQEAFDRMILLEDDVVIAPNYFALAENLQDWAEANYDNVGATGLWNTCKLSADAKKPLLDKVTASNIHWTAYTMPRSAWEDIKTILYTFEQKFLEGRHYSKRPHTHIRAYMRELVHEAVPPRGPRSFTAGTWFGIGKEMLQRNQRWPSGQDACTALALFSKGLCKIHTVVNRVQYIGRHGIHGNDKVWKNWGYDDIKLDVFPGDADLKEFTI